MNKKMPVGAAVSLIAIAAAVTFILTSAFSLNMFNSKVNVNERTEINKKLEELDKAVRNNYIGEIDEEKLTDSVARGYVSGVGDQYAHYYSTKEYQDQKLSDAGMSIGIGITVEQDPSGYLLIRSVRESSPAEETGLEEGDLIVAVNDTDVLSAGYSESMAAVAGAEGTTVKITVRRGGQDTAYQLVRRKMDNLTVTWRMLGNQVGYIKLSHFDGKTPEQFRTALGALTGDGAKSIIFDVRYNLGGLISSVSGVLNQILSEQLVATATYQDGSTKNLIQTDDAESLNLPMAVLVNGRSASSAELFACALRDFAGAKLVGVNTYGKGVMQNTIEMMDGSALTITYAKYQTTKTPCYDGVGLKPNFEVSLTKEEEQRFNELDETNDPQLKKALEVVSTTGTGETPKPSNTGSGKPLDTDKEDSSSQDLLDSQDQDSSSKSGDSSQSQDSSSQGSSSSSQNSGDDEE